MPVRMGTGNASTLSATAHRRLADPATEHDLKRLIGEDGAMGAPDAERQSRSCRPGPLAAMLAACTKGRASMLKHRGPESSPS